MNSYDAKAGVKLGFTAAGTLIGGPVGGAIGSAVGTLAGALIPTKTFINQKTSFNENVDQNMSYSRADYGKGFVNYTSQDREKATTFSKIADTAADVIPMVAGATNFKGFGKMPSLFNGKDAISKADEVIKTGNEVVEKSPISINKIFDYTAKNGVPKVIQSLTEPIEGDVSTQKEKVDIPIKSNFDAIDFDSSVNNIMKSIGDSPYKPIESYKETFSTPRNRFVPSSAVNDYLPSAKNSTFNYVSDTPKIEPLQKMKMIEPFVNKPTIRTEKQTFEFPTDLKNVDFDKEIEEYKKRNKNAKYYMSY